MNRTVGGVGGVHAQTLIGSLLTVLVGGACSDGVQEPAYIEGFVDRSQLASCEPVQHLTAAGLLVEDLVAAQDGGLLVLTGPSRQLIALDSALQVRWEIEFDEAGPDGVGSPASVAAEGDSLFWIADAGHRAIKVFDRHGQEHGTTRIGFHPTNVRRAAGETWVLPIVIGGFPDRLLQRVNGDRTEPMGPRPRYADGLGHIGFLNMMGAVTRPDGTLLVVHRFYVPRAFVWDGKERQQFTVPVPDELRPLFEKPRPVEHEEDMGYLPTVAVSPFIGGATGDVLYITRSGRKHPGGHWEKALIRVDSTFQYIASSILPVDALYAGPIGSEAVVVVNRDGEWHRCDAP